MDSLLTTLWKELEHERSLFRRLLQNILDWTADQDESKEIRELVLEQQQMATEAADFQKQCYEEAFCDACPARHTRLQAASCYNCQATRIQEILLQQEFTRCRGLRLKLEKALDKKGLSKMKHPKPQR